MGRCRFPAMKVDRLYLVDVHKARLQKLRDEGAGPTGKKRPATKQELADAERAITVAEADGAWIDVKHELTAGEANRANGRIVKEFRAGDLGAELDPERIVTTRVIEYLVGWSFTNENGQPVPFSPAMEEEDRKAAILSVDESTFVEMREAIDAHAERVSAEKNAPAPASA